MKQECKKTPEVRFKGFDGEWADHIIGGLGMTYNGLSGKTKEDFGIGDAKYITFLNVLTNAKIDTRILEAVNVCEGDRQNKVLKGDLLFNTSSETPEEVGMCAVMNEEVANVYLNSFCFGFRLTDTNITPLFLSYIFRSPIGRGLMSILAQGATRYNLSKTSFCKASIKLPSTKDEQQQIANYFAYLDTQITILTQYLERLKQIKAASLQAMFPQEGETTPKVRFKGFKGEWSTVKFSDVAQLRRGLTYSPSNIVEKGVRVLRSSNINEDSFVISDNDVFVDPNCVNINFAEECDIIITAANGSPRLVGKHALIPSGVKGKIVVGGFMLLATSNESSFLNASMSSYWYNQFLKVGVAGGNGAIGNINKFGLETCYIPYPNDKRERDCIASFFTNLDNQISLQTQKLEKLKQIKAACLDHMFV